MIAAVLSAGCVHDTPAQRAPYTPAAPASVQPRPASPESCKYLRDRHVPTTARPYVEPLDWPACGRISSVFGRRARRPHHGVDILAEAGSAVRASAAGRVVFSAAVPGYGNIVIIDHGDGLETRYAHNRENLVRKGQSVAVGEVIAKVGSSGQASGPHLHFEVHERGEPRNPLGFLPPLRELAFH